MRTRRPDKYDYIGLAVAGMLAIVWILHIVLPPLPPEPVQPGATIGHPFPG